MSSACVSPSRVCESPPDGVLPETSVGAPLQAGGGGGGRGVSAGLQGSGRRGEDVRMWRARPPAVSLQLVA